MLLESKAVFEFFSTKFILTISGVKVLVYRRSDLSIRSSVWLMRINVTEIFFKNSKYTQKKVLIETSKYEM